MTHSEYLRQAQEAIDKNAPLVSNGHFRQHYHFMAPAGWLNDPNGCIWHQGMYHLYYQHNPYAAVWGAMHWGHATSTDLLHWRHQPVALAPSEVYDDHPQGGVFSGSIVEDGNDELCAFYTGTTNHGDGFVQTQCMALSHDGGISFQKYQDNPVIDRIPEGISHDFRDPRVIRHNGSWYMVLGASLGKGAWNGGEGCACLYRSENLRKWEYLGIIARSEGKYGSMWECPDLFPLDGKWILTFSPMFMKNRKVVYLAGEMNFDIPRFNVLSDGEIDWGCEYYAAQSMTDDKGRRILMAWQNGWDWMPWWKDFGPTGREGWCGCMALPRTVTLDSANRLISQPVCELEMLRKNNRKTGNIKIEAKKISIPCADPVSFELKMEIDLIQTTALRLYILLRANEEKYTIVTIDFEAKKLRFDRNNSDNGYSSGIKECDLFLNDDFCVVHIFSDVSSLELFIDEGRTSMSNTIYPLHPNQETSIWAEGGEALIKTINTWSLAL